MKRSNPCYDHQRFSEILSACVESSDWDLDWPMSGEWVEEEGDPFKVMFDSYQEDDGFEEGVDRNLLCYVVFIHRDCLKDGFVFPEHETIGGYIRHRPKEEAALIGWFNRSEETWDWMPLESNHTELSSQEVMALLEGIWGKYWGRRPG
jgi:hypothetical protein